MRQALELAASLIITNPDQNIAASTKIIILQKLLLIISHQAAQPLVKPSLKALECFLSKGTITTSELATSYQEHILSRRPYASSEQIESTWDSIVSDLFDWMVLADVSPAVGKLLVTLFRELRKTYIASESNEKESTFLWQKWIRKGLGKYPDTLENVKNYLLPSLFKLDRPGSLEFLQALSTQSSLSDLGGQEVDAQALLQLSSLEIGKKLGLVEEPTAVEQQQNQSKRSTNTIVLQEDIVGSLLGHSSGVVRSLAFSVLVSSLSPARPFTEKAMSYMQDKMGILFADTDAKFRNETLSSTRAMVERIRGASAFLAKAVQSPSLAIDTEQKGAKHNSEEFGEDASTKEVPLQSLNSKDVDKRTELLLKHWDFVQWYLNFLCGEMIPTASYQRHVTALKATTQLIRSGILDRDILGNAGQDTKMWPYTIKYFTPLRMRLLLDLLLDPFEDVRAESATILKFASPNDFSDAKLLKPLANLKEFIARAKTIFKKTGRADHADGLARGYEILYSFLNSTEDRLRLFEDILDDIEMKVSAGEKDLARGIKKGPIHGQFAALRLIWESIDHSKDSKGHSSQPEEDTIEEWQSLTLRAMYSCSQIWEIVKNVLCDDSPEGHLPEELEGLENVGTKDVLSYSFRAIHESSNLMRAFVSKIRLRWPDNSPVVSPEVFNGIGAITFEQLSTLRHRGAFSTVSMTFATCCQSAQYQIPGERSRLDILEKWYKGALSCIFEQASTTRRSAGIPALITGILSANAPKPAFDEVIAELKSIARRQHRLTGKDETHLPQVHAMNCLKEIIKNSFLGRRFDLYVADCLEIAAESLNSEIWAVRNCSLLLLRGIIDSLFGTNEKKSIIDSGWDGRSIRLSYDKYPSLPQLLVKLLKIEINDPESSLLSTSTGVVESVFPALDIIRRAGPPETNRDEIYNCVSKHLGSSMWHVREIAARTICTMLLHEGWQRDIVELLETSNTSTNRLHGILLATKFTLEHHLELDPNVTSDSLSVILPVLQRPSFQDLISKKSEELQSAYIDILSAISIIRWDSGYRSPQPSSSPEKAINTESTSSKETFDQFSAVISKYRETHSRQKPIARSALLCTSVARRATFEALLAEDYNGITRILIEAAKVDIDLTLSILEILLPILQKRLSSRSFAGFSNILISLIENSDCPEIRATCLMHLAELLDRHNLSLSEQDLRLKYLDKLQHRLIGGARNPKLSISHIRISGLLMLYIYTSRDVDRADIITIGQRFDIWGQMLGDASHANNDFDVRYAAATSVGSFFRSPTFLSQKLATHLIPSLFTLYDTLNDDDDEIRNLSAATVSSILRTPLAALVARKKLAEWMCDHYRGETLFAWEAVYRMTGTEGPVVGVQNPQLLSFQTQLQIAMKDDNSLFVEEEQNLFIDEIRETCLWAQVFDHSSHLWDRQITALITWIKDGLLTLLSLDGLNDGPLGYTSRPSVFATIFRLLTCANAVMEHLENSAATEAGKLQDGTLKDILDYLERFIDIAAKRRVHEALVYVVTGQPITLTTSSNFSLPTNTSMQSSQSTSYQRLQRLNHLHLKT
ncbi:HEAT repeat protein-like protein [Xylogone sp. PMI_703]|nr:HEAT repeat protein-like protein [Xylogone sp. PMI_703]